MRADIRVGDALARLREMPHGSVRTIVTSPPYWGLRDYGVAGQIGLERTPAEFIARMVEVFRAARDVLADDGTLWMNMGDSYAAARGGAHQPAETLAGGKGGKTVDGAATNRGREAGYNPSRDAKAIGLKHKDLCMMPARLAIALQDDGWWLRQDIIWNKPNPMPESVTDRCTKAHEYLFLLAKRERYYFNAKAIREPATVEDRSYKTPDGWDTSKGGGGHGSFHREGREAGYVGYEKKRDNGVGFGHGYDEDPKPRTVRSGNKERKPATARGVPEGTGKNQSGPVPWEGDTRNKRSVWTIPTEPYAEAHFATFPRALVRPCILAGSEPGDTILDPFGGSGTTVEVALALGRHGIMIELNPKYAELARRRLANVTYGLALEA